MNEPGIVVREVGDEAEAARLTAGRLEELIAEAVALRGVAHVALAGGETPRPAYELLAPRLGEHEAVELWFGDERAVPPDDPESNFRTVAEAFSEAALPEEAIHRIEGERGAEEAADAYAALLTERLPTGEGNVPVLDVALLGLGDDGHTASLFPGNSALDAEGACAPVHDAPKPPPDRVTLTVPVLRQARRLVFLVTGADKAEAVATLLRGDDDEQPATMVAGPQTELIADTEALSAD
jgi:6-phosphogluconolactonase